MQATTAPGSSDGEFVDKTDLAPGTKWTATDANAWQAELLHVITEAGLTPSGADLEQVRKAIQALAKLVKVDEATEADHAASADEATEADHAASADNATNAGNASYANEANLVTISAGTPSGYSPSTSSGKFAFDSSYVYIKIPGTKTWKRIAADTVVLS